MNIKVGIDFYKYVIITVEAKLDSLAMNKREVKLLYFATVNSLHSDETIPSTELKFEPLRIMNGWHTIEECLEDAVKILRERVK